MSEFTLAEVAAHKIPTDLWIIISSEVYNVSDFQNKHPGGAKILQNIGGRDGTKQFKKLHNERILKTPQYKDLCIGTVKTGNIGATLQKEGGLWGLFKRRKAEPSTA